MTCRDQRTEVQEEEGDNESDNEDEGAGSDSVPIAGRPDYLSDAARSRHGMYSYSKNTNYSVYNTRRVRHNRTVHSEVFNLFCLSVISCVTRMG